MRTNDDWACKVTTQVSEQAKHASPWTKSLLRRVSEQTHQETKDSITGKGMTLAQLRTRYGSGPSMSCCVLRRHGIPGKDIRFSSSVKHLHNEFSRAKWRMF